MSDQIVKTTQECLDRNTQTIERLPGYLTVNDS